MGIFHCEVTKIVDILPHSNADLLQIAKVWDYSVVIRKDEFQVGDLVSYISLDAIVGNHPTFAFLGKEALKPIRAKRLRGVFSQGLLVPAPAGFSEGDSIVEHFGITRWIAPEDREDAGIGSSPDGLNILGKNGRNEKSPETFKIPHYDIEPLRKFFNYLEEGEEVVLEEKIHGQNFSTVFAEGKLWVKSRNFYKVEDPESQWWIIPLEQDFKNRLDKFPNKVFFGEYYGNVSKFRYDCPIENNIVKRKFRVFDVYDLDAGKYLDYDTAHELIKEAGLESCPVLYRGPWTKDSSLYDLAEGESSLGNNMREGFVLRSLSNPWDHKGNRKIYKLIAKQYLLKDKKQ